MWHIGEYIAFPLPVLLWGSQPIYQGPTYMINLANDQFANYFLELSFAPAVLTFFAIWVWVACRCWVWEGASPGTHFSWEQRGILSCLSRGLPVQSPMPFTPVRLWRPDLATELWAKKVTAATVEQKPEGGSFRGRPGTGVSSWDRSGQEPGDKKKKRNKNF